MSASSRVSTESKAPGVGKRRRFRLRLAAFATGGLFSLPTVLQMEPHPQRADTLQVVGPAASATGHGAGSSRGRGRPAQIAAAAQRPFYGALREAPPSELETLSSLRGRASSTPRPAGLEVQNPQIGDFSTPAAVASTPVSFPAAPAPSFPAEPGTVLIGGPSGPPTTPNPPAPPVIVPPVVTPPVVTPPVTPPVVTPPVTTPPGPPVVTPPDNPPVSPPGVVTPPEPPIIDPFPPPPDGGPGPGDPGPGGPGPGGPGPGGPGGPPPGVPEPSVWIELILGAGLAGAALRQRRRLVASV